MGVQDLISWITWIFKVGIKTWVGFQKSCFRYLQRDGSRWTRNRGMVSYLPGLFGVDHAIYFFVQGSSFFCKIIKSFNEIIQCLKWLIFSIKCVVLNYWYSICCSPNLYCILVMPWYSCIFSIWYRTQWWRGNPLDEQSNLLSNPGFDTSKTFCNQQGEERDSFVVVPQLERRFHHPLFEHEMIVVRFVLFKT